MIFRSKATRSQQGQSSSVEPDGTVGYAWAAENPGIQPDYAEVISYCLKN